MLSIVQGLDQVFILNNLDVEKITVSGNALNELERLDAISFNMNLTPWYDDDCLHVASFNCAGLRAHIDDIRTDAKLLRADLIHLQEISIENEYQGIDICQLPGFQSSFIYSGRGKGIASFRKCGFVSSTFKGDNFQVSRSQLHGVECINVYRSQAGSISSLMKKLDEEIDQGQLKISFISFC